MAEITTAATTTLPSISPTARPVAPPKPSPSPSCYARLLHTHTTLQLSAVLLPSHLPSARLTEPQPASWGRRQPRSPAPPPSPKKFDSANLRIPERMVKRVSVGGVGSCGSGTVGSPRITDGFGETEGSSDGDEGSSRRVSGEVVLDANGMLEAWKEPLVIVRACSLGSSPGSGKCVEEMGAEDEGVDVVMG